MKDLIAFLNSLSRAEQDSFARRCGTSVGYLRKAASGGQKLGLKRCLAIERESDGRLTLSDLNHEIATELRRSRYVRIPPGFNIPHDFNGQAAAPSRPAP